MLLPWAASLFSGDIEQARSLSARAAMIFAAKALPDSPVEPILYYVLNQGMIEALNRMAAQFTTVQVLTGASVSQVLREPHGGFRIRCADGRIELVDDLVFASSGPGTVQLLEGLPGTLAQQAVLRGIEFNDARLVLHTDPIYAPPNPNHWSFLNCRLQGAYCEASMWMADVLPIQPQTAAKIWKSWVTHRSQQPAQILHESSFKHMLPTPGSIAAQTALSGLQGLGGIWFTGGYTLPYDSQETALLSAMNVADRLGGATTRSRRLLAGG
jgi:predicted NAD/FAD-binding protein